MARSGRSRLFYPKARSLFPADSELAKWMLPAMVLRADLWLEYHGIGAEDEVHEGLHASTNDANEFHSRLYFFRGTLRSLYSAKVVLNRLMGLEEFRKMMDASKHRAEFDAHLKGLHQAASEYEPLRNSIGGHVENSVAEARAIIGDDDVWSVEFSDGRLTARSAAPVLSAVIFGQEVTEEELKARLIRMREAGLAAFRALELVVNVYLQGRIPKP